MTGHDYGHIIQLRVQWKRVPPPWIWGKDADPNSYCRDRTPIAHGTCRLCCIESNIRRALEAAGVEFIDENGGGPGVRLRERLKVKPPRK